MMRTSGSSSFVFATASSPSEATATISISGSFSMTCRIPIVVIRLASARRIHIKVGAAYRKNGKVVPYGTVPKKGECPRGGFFGKTEVTFGGSFGGERDFGIPAKTVTNVIRVPCPSR